MRLTPLLLAGAALAVAVALEVPGARAARGKEPPAELLAALDRSPDGEAVRAAAETILEGYRDHPRAPAAAEILADFHYARGEYRTAARLYATAAQGTRDETARRRRLLARGRALLGAGEHGSAAAVFEEILARDPAESEARLGLADAALLAGKTERAAALYREIADRAPAASAAPLALAQLARTLDGLGRSEEALVAARRLAEAYPRASEAAAARDRLRRAARSRGPGAPASPDPAPLAAAGQDTALAGRYSLQVGAFGTEANARELALELEKWGMAEVRVEPEERGGRTFHRVRVGAYPDSATAAAEAERLRETRGLGSQVVPR